MRTAFVVLLGLLVGKVALGSCTTDCEGDAIYICISDGVNCHCACKKDRSAREQGIAEVLTDKVNIPPADVKAASDEIKLAVYDCDKSGGKARLVMKVKGKPATFTVTMKWP
jgi:hypothetical protein